MEAKVAYILKQIDYLAVLTNKQFVVEYKRLFVTCLAAIQCLLPYKRFFYFQNLALTLLI